MYNETSGMMYEEEEENKRKRERKKKIIRRRIISVIMFSLILIYFIILLVDINRFKNGYKPLIILGEVTKEYDDGYVKTAISIGWVFREYNRETIKDDEMVPIWSPIRMDNVLNRVNEKDLPEIETDYEIPDNRLNASKVDNVLFFFDANTNLLDTYKCLYSEKDCEIATSQIYPSDENQYTPYQMGIIDNRYVFITEYQNKDTEAEIKTIFLYDINAKKIIAKYESVRYSTILDNLGYIDNSKYIVKKNGKWGIDQVIKGSVSNVADYTHDQIKFDSNSGMYIFKDNDKYYGYNANTKDTTEAILEEISKIYYVNDKIYLETKTKDEYYSNIYYYKLYNSDGTNVLSGDKISDFKPYDNFLIYIEDKKVHIINYDGEDLVQEDINVYFDYSIYNVVDNLKITITGNTLILSTPKTKEKTHYTDEYYYDTNTWNLIKKRTNVKETLE